MSNFLINDEKEVKVFVAFLNKLNQIFKTSVENKTIDEFSCYSLTNGKIYSFNNTLLANIIATPIFVKKENFFEDNFKKLNLYINGKELYDFLKDNKSYINEFKETEEGDLLIKTSLPQVEYKIESLNSYLNKDIQLYKNFKNNAYKKYLYKKEPLISYKIDDDTITSILESDYPILIEIKSDNSLDIKLRLTKKSLLALKKSTTKVVSKLTLDIYQTDIDDIFIIDANIDNSNYSCKFTSRNFFSIINF